MLNNPDKFDHEPGLKKNKQPAQINKIGQTIRSFLLTQKSENLQNGK